MKRALWLQAGGMITAFLVGAGAACADYGRDLYITPENIRVPADIIGGITVRMYATVNNASAYDLSGVVKFYDERDSSFIGQDQPVSVLSGKTDDVFVDWTPSGFGEHAIAVRVVPWSAAGDDPGNNKVVRTVLVDRDTDGDGMGNNRDPDDDNDGSSDVNDAFPENPAEWQDTDRDGTGNNADTDDDGDGVPDVEDAFPVDAGEAKDSDGDGVGDHRDRFPDDPKEWMDSDNDGLGNNSDPDNKNHGPVPHIETATPRVKNQKTITFNALKSYDPDGQIVDYEWDFGDGEVQKGVVVEHPFKKTGTYSVMLRVIDNKGEMRKQVLEVQVRPRWPGIALGVVTGLLVLLLLPLVIRRKRPKTKKHLPKKKK